MTWTAKYNCGKWQDYTCLFQQNAGVQRKNCKSGQVWHKLSLTLLN